MWIVVLNGKAQTNLNVNCRVKNNLNDNNSNEFSKIYLFVK